jgi:type I restriction enzyme S subunit
VMATTPERVALREVMRERKHFVMIKDADLYKRCRVQLHARGIELRDEVLGSQIRTKRQQICREGDFLVAEIDAKVGGYGMVPRNLDGAIVSSHYFLYELDHSKVDAAYFALFVRSAAFGEQVTARGSTNYAAIRSSDVLEYLMPLPELNRQKMIAAQAASLAQQISAVAEYLDLTVGDVQSLYPSGVDSLVASLEGSVHGLKALCEKYTVEYSGWRRTGSENNARPGDLVEVAGSLGMNPGWRRVGLGGICTHIVDCVNDTPLFEDEPTGLVAIKSTNVRPARLDLNERWYVTASDWAHWNRRLEPEAGDLLLTREAPLGNVCLVPEGVSLCLTQRVVVARVDRRFFEPRFVMHVLNSADAQRQIAALGRSNPPHIRIRDIPLIAVPICDLETQRIFVDCCDALLALARDIEDRSNRMRSDLRSLDRAFLAETFG